MTLTPARIGEWVVVITAILAGGLWLGSLNNRVQAGEQQLKQVSEESKKTPTEIAVLQSQMDTVQKVQQKQDEKLDKILEEVRRR